MNKALSLLALLLFAAAVHAADSERTYITPPGADPKVAPPYSSGVLVNGTYYVSGTLGVDPATGKVPADAEAEVHLVLDSVKQTLERAGLTMADLVSGTIRHPLAKRGYLTAVALDRIFSGVISRQRQADIVAESIDEKLQIAGAGMHILPRVIGVRDAKAARGRGHQLHQANRPALGNRTRIESRFHHDHGPQKIGLQRRGHRGVFDDGVVLRCLRQQLKVIAVAARGPVLRRENQQSIAVVVRDVGGVPLPLCGDVGGNLGG